MERLTERDEFGNADIIGADSADLQLNLGYDEFNLVTKALNRLAFYEDTGLEPEEIKAIMLGSASMNFENLNGYPINELIRLYKAEQEGRLVVLPCNVGGSVYRIEHDEDGDLYVVKDLCAGATIGLSGELLIVMSGDRRWSAERFGKSIFLTRDAAEAALKERGSDH